jgi:hypothetical protein
MAATAALYTGDRLVAHSPELHPWPRRTGSDERKGLRARIANLAGLWNGFTNAKRRTCESGRVGYTGTVSGIKDVKSVKYQTRAIHTLDLFSPPSYEESLADVPQDYTVTDALATVQGLVDVNLDLGVPEAGLRHAQRRSDVKVDLTEPQGIRYHAKKKAKAAAKNAQKDKWGGDDEEKKEEAPADDGAGGGDAGGGDGAGDTGGGGGGGGGDGGDDPPGGDGGGDDPDDIWGAAGGGKKKKKKKKNAW